MRYAMQVGPGDSGMRISLRRRYPDGMYGDILGILESWVDGVVTVRRASGEVVVMDATDVIAAKRVPPPPPRR